ncbi:MAG: hypothetical protein H8E55_65600 [Pelagibacterales bacterium]|nr:hypothetical protein [Pelagibacterales bacterium]
MYRLQIIDYNEKKLIVKRRISEHSLKPGFDTKLLKEWSMSDIILKRDGIFYCCETIQEAEIIEGV